ncbi:MAG: hypothetical protein GXO04_00660 [Aquificae bacterium]|nr:hypothetical protein [Aquificota bacterium]
MKSKLEQVSLLLERYLGDIFGRIRVYREGYNFLIPWGFTVINVGVDEDPDEEVYVNVNSPVALRVKPTKDLMRFLLSENANLKMASFFTEFEKGFMDIVVGIKVRYKDLSREMLKFIVLNVGNIANEYGREIIAVFGGISFKEYLERRKTEAPFYGEKIFQEKLGKGLVLEVYTRDDTYTLLCRKEGTSEPLIKAQRSAQSPYEMLKLMQSVKEALERKDFSSLRKLLSPFELNLFSLYAHFLEGESLKRLKSLEMEINELPTLLINGKISYEEYKKRIKEIEREIGLL